MIASTGGCLAAARFGLAPSVKKVASAGLKLSEREVNQVTGDPAGEDPAASAAASSLCCCFLLDAQLGLVIEA